MTAPPPIPDRPELFCTGCLRWLPRAAIVAARWIPRGRSRQARYICQTCVDRRDRNAQGPRRGG